jgi:raffinose/stachyose/melibiose transport system permease protein
MRRIAAPAGRGRAQSATAALANHSYLLPAVVLVGAFVYHGIAFNLAASLTDWDGLSPRGLFVGLANYREIAGDRVFGQALLNTAIWATLTIGGTMVLGFGLAALVCAAVPLRGLVASLIMLPSVSATVVAAISAKHILAGDGAANALLAGLGLGRFARAWLADPDTALYALALANIWQWTGFAFLLYVAALSLIDQEVVEAAILDGASLATLVWRILFPMCRPTSHALLVLGIIQSLKTFDIVYLTTRGGPGRATEVLSTYVFGKALIDGRAGYAAALSVVLVALALASTATLLAWQSRGSEAP